MFDVSRGLVVFVTKARASRAVNPEFELLPGTNTYSCLCMIQGLVYLCLCL